MDTSINHLTNNSQPQSIYFMQRRSYPIPCAITTLGSSQTSNPRRNSAILLSHLYLHHGHTQNNVLMPKQSQSSFSTLYTLLHSNNNLTQSTPVHIYTTMDLILPVTQASNVAITSLGATTTTTVANYALHASPLQGPRAQRQPGSGSCGREASCQRQQKTPHGRRHQITLHLDEESRRQSIYQRPQELLGRRHLRNPSKPPLRSNGPNW